MVSSSNASAKRKYRVRNKIRQKAGDRARLSVNRSNKHISAQIIDLATGRVVASVSTTQKNIAEGLKATCNITAAEKVGAEIAKIALKEKVEHVVFDRGSLLYHGKVKALAEAARKSGLKF